MSDAAIDDWLHVFSSLDTKLTREEIAALYGARGWSVRKSSQLDYEVSCDWCELVIEAESPVLMHGVLADLTRAEEMVGPLRRGGISFVAEWYSQDHTLLRELRS